MRGCGYQDVARYGQAFRDRIVARLLPPESAAIDVVSREVGVSVGTLDRWRAQALADPGTLASSQRWTPTARLEAVITTAAMEEAARSAWCREQGLYPAELEAWKRDAIAGLGEPRAMSAAEARQDRRRVKELERELHRKDKVLAETAALLVLAKKPRLAKLTGRLSAPTRRGKPRGCAGSGCAGFAPSGAVPACGGDRASVVDRRGRVRGRWAGAAALRWPRSPGPRRATRWPARPSCGLWPGARGSAASRTAARGHCRCGAGRGRRSSGTAPAGNCG